MKNNTDIRLKNGKEVTKDELITQIKTSDAIRFDQMLIETEERKTYYYVKYNSIAFKRTPYVLKFPLFKDLVNDFEKSINDTGEITILDNEDFIQKVKSKDKRSFLGSEKSESISKLDKAKNTASKISDTYSSLKNTSLTSVVGSAINSGLEKITETDTAPKSNSNLGYYTPKVHPKFISEQIVFSELKIITENDKIKLKQPLYYIPNETERCVCGTCDGEKYNNCSETECNGQHIYDCSKCRTSGKLDCDGCNARGEYTCPSCNGKGRLRCTACGGSGNDKDSKSILSKCKQCNGSGERKCSSLSGHGLLGAAVKKTAGNEYCGGSGIIRCSKCHATGKITCDKCEGGGKIECKTCYGDHQDNRYGKVDCKTCETAGELASISYIETEIIVDDLDFIFTDGKKIEAPNFDVSTIKKFANLNSKLNLTYKNLNGDNKENYDEHSTFCSKNALTQIGNSKEKYPKLISEEMYYEGVPCATFNYNHILSASFHDVSVLSIDKEQEVFYHSNPADVSEEKESFIKKIKELFRKAFSTKSFKDKIDRKHEMFLMVHMAKADGIIEEKEKRYLSKSITSLDGFTNKEKAEIFGLMSTVTLPAISPLNAYFSSKERAEEAKVKLVELVAKADGEYEPQEKEKLEEINKAIEMGFKAKPSAISQFFSTWQVSLPIIVSIISILILVLWYVFFFPNIQAKNIHNQLLSNEEIIIESIKSGNKTYALLLLNDLQHPSDIKFTDGDREITYSKYWQEKFSEYTNELEKVKEDIEIEEDLSNNSTEETNKVDLSNYSIVKAYSGNDQTFYDWLETKPDSITEFSEWVRTLNDSPIDNIRASSVLKSQGANSYDVSNLSDNNPSTAWVEGKEDYGIGEYLEFETYPNTNTFYAILNGYQSDKKTWQANSRIKRLKVMQRDKIICIIELQDKMGIQTFEIIDENNLFDEDGDKIRLVIDEVYEGDKYKDVAISELFEVGSYD